MTQLIFKDDRCEWILLRVGGATVVVDSATGEADQAEEEEEGSIGAVAEEVDPGTVDHRVTEIVTEEAGQETVEAFVETSQTAQVTVTLTGALLVVASSPEDRPATGALQIARSFGSPHQRSCLHAPG